MSEASLCYSKVISKQSCRHEEEEHMGNLSFSCTDREAPTPDNKEDLQTESPTQHISVRMTAPESKQD